jgi:hypothetical protein
VRSCEEPLFLDQESNEEVPALKNKVQILGYGGLIPFVFFCISVWIVSPELQPFAALALTGYASTIVAFLGGIHWGIAFKVESEHREFHIVWGVIPSIVAWICVIMPAYAALPLLAVMLIVCYLVDRKTWPLAGLEEWLKLRLILTVVASLSCLVAAGAA